MPATELPPLTPGSDAVVGPTAEYAAGPRERIERLALRVLGRLPRRVLRRLAGRPVVIDGSTLHPAFQIGLQATATAQRERVDVEQSRADLERSAWVAAGPTITVGATRELTVDGAEEPLPARLYVPEDTPAAIPLLVYFHGGGWAAGSIASHDNVCRALCHDGRVAVLSVGYRLAPERPFPAAVHDVRAAYDWVLTHAAGFGVDPQRVCVGGDSAGANLAAVLCQLLRADGAPLPRLQLLLVPGVDLSRRSASYASVGRGFYLSADDVDWFEAQYLTDPTQANDPRVSPLLTDDLSGLPPAHIAIAGFDPLRDEGLAYAERLRAAGVAVTERVYPDLVHPMASTLVLADCRAVLRDAADSLRRVAGDGVLASTPTERGLSRLGVLARMPLALGQARRVARDTPRLAEATTRQGRVGPAEGEPLRVALVGDSVAAGVGVEDHAQTVAGEVAAELCRRTGRPVAWEVFAQSGADASTVAWRVGNASALAGCDLVVVSVGVNDLKGLRSDRRWRGGLSTLLGRITAAAPEARVLLLPLPPVERFPALAGRLGTLMARRAVRLNAIARDVVRTFPTVQVLDFPVTDIDEVADAFAADGFHPSGALHAAIARRSADALDVA